MAEGVALYKNYARRISICCSAATAPLDAHSSLTSISGCRSGGANNLPIALIQPLLVASMFSYCASPSRAAGNTSKWPRENRLDVHDMDDASRQFDKCFLKQAGEWTNKLLVALEIQEARSYL